MKKQDLEEKTRNLLLISRKTLEKLEPSKNNLMGNLKYWKKNNKLIVLKNGLYVLKDNYDKELNKDQYLEYISCQLVQPSYLSLEYIMAKYQLLTEPVNCFTAVTVKKTSLVQNKLATFRYYSITLDLFTGYEVEYFYGAPIWRASKEKAVFDFLYLRFIRNQSVNERVIDDLRINWEEISVTEWRKVASFRRLTKSKRVGEAIQLIEKMYFSSSQII